VRYCKISLFISEDCLLIVKEDIEVDLAWALVYRFPSAYLIFYRLEEGKKGSWRKTSRDLKEEISGMVFG
jgi:hypothetical protein